MAKLSELPADEAREYLYEAFMGAHEAHAGGAEIKHPSQAVNDWVRAARDHANESHEAGEDDENTGLGPKYLEPTDRPVGDDPKRIAGMPPPSVRGKPTQDSRPDWSLTPDERVQRGYLQRRNPAAAADMASKLKNYDRLR